MVTTGCPEHGFCLRSTATCGLRVIGVIPEGSMGFTMATGVPTLASMVVLTMAMAMVGKAMVAAGGKAILSGTIPLFQT